MTVMMIVVALVAIGLFLQMRETPDRSKKLEDILPLYKIEQDCILSKQGDITIAFRVELPEIFSLSADQYEALHQTWIKAIKVLPRMSVVHKQDWFTEARYTAAFDADQSFLQRASERYFNERPYLDHACYLMLTKKPKDRKPASSVFSNLLRASMVPQETVNKALFQEFMDAVGQFEKILSDSGFVTLHRMGADELAGTEEKTGLIERYLFLLSGDQSPQLRDIVFKPEWKIGDNHCQMFSLGDVENLPAMCGSRIDYEKYCTDRTRFSVSFAAPLGQVLSCNHIYNQFVVIDDAPKTMKKLEAKRLRLQSLAAYSRENAISRDAVNSFLNEAISQGRLPVKAHFHVLAWTDKAEELKDMRNKVSSALAQMEATPHQETKGAPQLFWAALPGNAADLPFNECFDTFCEQATCFLNQETNYRSSTSPVGIRLSDRVSGRPVHVDLSDEPMKRGIINNRNRFVLAGSGGGKSFFCNHILRSYWQTGAHCVVVDIGHSYKGLCSHAKGYYFTYEEDNPIRFNPFYTGDGDSMDTEKKESIKTLLLALWKRESEEFRRSEYVALSNALTMYFAHLQSRPEIFPCFNTFYEFLQAEFMDVLRKDKVKDKDFDIDNFLYVLRPYFRGGEFDFLLNATENLDLLQQRFVVIELDNIKDHPVLLTVVTLVTMQMFINKMRKLKGIRKVILIEEAWKAIARESFAEYIKYLFKTVRKFQGEAMVVSQEIDDIISSPIVKQAIINNSDCKILLDQSKYLNRFDQIQQLLGLTDKEKAFVLSLNRANEPGRKYKEVFISLGGTYSKVYRVEVSPEEYLTYTTEESEKVKVMQYAARYDGDIERGIEALLNKQN